jgi:uncharacterized protein
MSTDEPVTVVVTRSIKPGLEQAAESWAARAIEVASRWPGHLGGFVIRQAPGHFSLVFRFASLDRLMAWESSGERAALLEEVAPLTAGITAQRLSGLEPFFALPGAPLPPRWKMAVVTWLVAFPLIQVLQVTLGPVLTSWPALLRGAVMGAAMVVVMTYLAMPAMTRALRRWLFP